MYTSPFAFTACALSTPPPTTTAAIASPTRAAGREAEGPGGARRVVLVVPQLDDENTLLDVLHAERLLRGFRDDPLVGFAVDHDLPLARTDRLAAGSSGPGRLCELHSARPG